MNQIEKQEPCEPELQTPDSNDRTMGPWSFEENLFYISFLEKNRGIMSSKKKRRQLRIFDRMSSFIGSRNPLQCRSHHQKLLEKMGDFKVIIKNFKKNVGKKYFKEQYRRCLSRIPIQPAQPPVKEEDDSQQTERLSPSPDNSPQQPQQDLGSYSFVDYAYFHSLNQQIMTNFMMTPFFFPF